jgi:hypothetical protein
MRRLLRRTFLLGVLAAVGWVAYRQVAGRHRKAEAPPWSPLPVGDRPQPARSPGETAGESVAPKWAAPVDGDAPEGFPIKANDGSRIFHVPGGRFYQRTTAHRCYATADDALADGYRPAKA